MYARHDGGTERKSCYNSSVGMNAGVVNIAAVVCEVGRGVRAQVVGVMMMSRRGR